MLVNFTIFFKSFLKLVMSSRIQSVFTSQQDHKTDPPKLILFYPGKRHISLWLNMPRRSLREGSIPLLTYPVLTTNPFNLHPHPFHWGFQASVQAFLFLSHWNSSHKFGSQDAYRHSLSLADKSLKSTADLLCFLLLCPFHISPLYSSTTLNPDIEAVINQCLFISF